LEELDNEVDALRLKTRPLVTRFLREMQFIQDRTNSQFHRAAGQRLQAEKTQFTENTQAFDRVTRYTLRNLHEDLHQHRNDLRFVSQRPISKSKNILTHIIDRLQSLNERRVMLAKNDINEMSKRLGWSAPLKLQDQQQQLDRLEQYIHLVNPVHILNRGYAIVRNEQGVLSETNTAKPNSIIEIETANQKLTARIDKEEKQ
jgi:exodeoxyribonuclease VII large subunit